MFQDLGRNSVYVGSLFGTPVFVHWSAIMMLFWAWAWAGTPPAGSVEAQWLIIILISLILGLVLHEVGHAVMHRLFGAQAITIFLTGFGGLCASNRQQESTGRDMLIVGAGPGVNLLLGVAAWFAPELMAKIDPGLLGNSLRKSLPLLFCMAMFKVNIGLFLINMLPIYPLDGGRLVYGGAYLVTRRRLIARQLALSLSIVGSIAYFMWSTGLFAELSRGGTVGSWIGLLGGWDIMLAVFLWMLVSSAWRDLR
jgi:Zn-dependent protease